jgi:hypothetical protein
MSKVEIREWKTLDIYFKDEDYNAVQTVIKEYEERGYEFQQYDNASVGGYESVAQLISRTTSKTKKLKP